MLNPRRTIVMPIFGMLLAISLLPQGGGCGAPPALTTDEARVEPYATDGDPTPYGIPLSVDNAATFIEYYYNYKLTPEQEAVKKEALTALVAPCCDDNTMYTCCCTCNLAKTVWGLSAHLIVTEGADASTVRDAALQWLRFIRPDYYRVHELLEQGQDPRDYGLEDIDSCYTGRCELPFSQGGCGGMEKLRLE